MKIRTDFVTNSSSSSFILGFESKEEMERLVSENTLGWSIKTQSEVLRDFQEGIEEKENIKIGYYKDKDEVLSETENYKSRIIKLEDLVKQFDKGTDPTSMLKKKMEPFSIITCVSYDVDGNGGTQLENDIAKKFLPPLKDHILSRWQD